MEEGRWWAVAASAPLAVSFIQGVHTSVATSFCVSNRGAVWRGEGKDGGKSAVLRVEQALSAVVSQDKPTLAHGPFVIFMASLQ